MKKFNIFKDISVDKEKEIFFEILSTKAVKIERIVSNGQKSEENFWYDQDKNEFVMILEGSAILEIKEDDVIKEISLEKGDYLDIKAHTLHRVKYTDTSSSTIWLAVFYE